MAALNDPVILGQFKQVLANWQYTGYVTATEPVAAWLARELPNVRYRDLLKALFQFVENGGIIDQQIEKRPEWNTWPFHYDFRLNFAGRYLFVETLLRDDDPNDPTIQIVSIHDV